MEGYLSMYLFSTQAAYIHGRTISSPCPTGIVKNQQGKIEICGRYGGTYGEALCPGDSVCHKENGNTHGICCKKFIKACGFGKPSPDVCGTIRRIKCPKHYKCVSNPDHADDWGICCPKKFTKQCKFGKSSGNVCGTVLGLPCPTNYECVADPTLADDWGICCPKTGGQTQTISPTWTAESRSVQHRGANFKHSIADKAPTRQTDLRTLSTYSRGGVNKSLGPPSNQIKMRNNMRFSYNKAGGPGGENHQFDGSGPVQQTTSSITKIDVTVSHNKTEADMSISQTDGESMHNKPEVSTTESSHNNPEASTAATSQNETEAENETEATTAQPETGRTTTDSESEMISTSIHTTEKTTTVVAETEPPVEKEDMYRNKTNGGGPNQALEKEIEGPAYTVTSKRNRGGAQEAEEVEIEWEPAEPKEQETTTH